MSWKTILKTRDRVEHFKQEWLQHYSDSRNMHDEEPPEVNENNLDEVILEEIEDQEFALTLGGLSAKEKQEIKLFIKRLKDI